MKLSPARQLQKGFTLIELLVVIGILGILAAALIATIDPFEQLNKATDSTTVNTLTEYQNALLRYYTNKGDMPWNDAVDKCYNGTQTNAISSMLPLNPALSSCVVALVQESELKQAFTTATAALSQIYMAADTDNNVTMCYKPISKSQQRNVNTKFDANGNLTTGCLSQTNPGVSCYWCTR